MHYIVIPTLGVGVYDKIYTKLRFFCVYFGSVYTVCVYGWKATPGAAWRCAAGLWIYTISILNNKDIIKK